MALKFIKWIKDPIHGYIGLTQVELDLLSSPLLQRLRDIQQLSFVELVYPDARHNRLGHSLGVMHLAGRWAEFLQQNSKDIYTNKTINIRDKDVQHLRIAGLLHDIGHGPFSHASEFVLKSFIRWLKSINENSVHENFAERIICNNKIKKILEKYKIDVKKIISLIKGNSDPPFYGQIIKSVIDADKLDYLTRDSYHAGVPEYGTLDLLRVIFTSRIHNGNIVWFRKGLYAAESVILSKFFIYRAVYFHHTVRAAWAMCEHMLYFAFKENIISEKDFQIDKFYNVTDKFIIGKILMCKKKKSKAHWYLKQLLERNLPKCILENQEIRDNGIRQRFEKKINGIKDIESRLKVEKKLADILDCKTEEILLDSAILVPYPPPLSKELEPLIVEKEKENSKRLSECSRQIDALQGTITNDVRIYSCSDKKFEKDTVINSIKKLLKEI